MAKGDFDFPLCNPLKTTKKGAAAPSLGFSPGGQLVRRKFVIFANVGRTHGGFYIVGADDSVRPLKCCDFASDFRENGRFLRADRVVRPYGVE